MQDFLRYGNEKVKLSILLSIYADWINLILKSTKNANCIK